MRKGGWAGILFPEEGPPSPASGETIPLRNRRCPFMGKHKIVLILALACLFCAGLWGCGAQEPPEEADPTQQAAGEAAEPFDWEPVAPHHHGPGRDVFCPLPAGIYPAVQFPLPGPVGGGHAPAPGPMDGLWDGGALRRRRRPSVCVADGREQLRRALPLPLGHPKREAGDGDGHRRLPEKL